MIYLFEQYFRSPLFLNKDNSSCPYKSEFIFEKKIILKWRRLKKKIHTIFDGCWKII